MTSKEAPGYAEMSSELDEIISKLQQESTDIDYALRLYERGLKLINQLEDYLKNAENRIVEIKTAPRAAKKSRRQEA
jgi:exodeoxyribonuclease VII small subunit